MCRAHALFDKIALFKTTLFWIWKPKLPSSKRCGFVSLLQASRQALKQRRPRRGRRPRRRWTGRVQVVHDGDGLRRKGQRGGLLASAELQSDLLQASKWHRFEDEP